LPYSRKGGEDMVRPAQHYEGEIKVALQMDAEATTLQELRV